METITNWIHDDEQVPAGKPFEVTDLDSADWAVGKAVQAQQEIEVLQAYAKTLHARIDERIAAMKAEHERTLEFMAGALRPWTEREIAGKKGNTVKLVSGSVQIRKLPDRVEIDDEDALVAWAEEKIPGIVHVKKSVPKSEVKKLVALEWDVPHSHIEQGEHRLYIKGE